MRTIKILHIFYEAIEVRSRPPELKQVICILKSFKLYTWKASKTLINVLNENIWYFTWKACGIMKVFKTYFRDLSFIMFL